ncbi:FAD-dependent oxidoreductase [Angelakisella massiliensis]|uniref:oxidoreductase n=1 Tax=Angelakisella massiliensis TaxID=1871018 RepID=UPI0023A7B19B|nr:FAD-dependent oxidoreductase [Angelakisella massiliensis]
MSILFTPGKIGKLELKNRVIFPSMCNFYCDEKGFVTDRLRAFVEARAAGGTAMIIMPGSPHGTPGPGRPALSDPIYYDGWRSLRDICHRYGCKLVVQIHPAKAQAGRDPSLLLPDNMDQQYIDLVVNSYARCAAAAREIGLDGVEIHGAHAHEVAQFMSPYYNHRQDAYGGTPEKRCKLAVDIIRAIKEQAGEDFPLIFRLSSSERFPGGRTVEETAEIVPLLEQAGADALHVSTGMPLSEEYISAPMDVPDGFNLPQIARIKEEVSIPVIAVDRINTPQLAQQVLEQGLADFTAIGRGQLADPDFVRKAQTGEPICLCLGCNQGCRKSVTKKAIYCVQNPRTGREDTLRFTPAPHLKDQKILIIGAGVSGLEAAIDLALRGASPVIWERRDCPGGLMELAQLPPSKSAMARMVEYRLSMAKKLGIAIHTGMEATPEKILAYGPDLLIIATGSVPAVPPIPGLEGAGVVTGDEALRNPALVTGQVAVLGGGLVGTEVAETLAARGVSVTVMEMGDAIGAGLNKNRMVFVRRRLEEGHVTLLTKTRVVSAALPDITVEDETGVHTLTGFDTMVAATGRKPENHLAKQLKAAQPQLPVYLVGDAKQPGMAMDAVTSAALLAASL